MGANKRRRYDADFKKNAVHLTNDPTRKVAEVAANLGISKDLLYSWRRQLQEQGSIAFPGNGKEALTEEEKKIRDLEKKLRDTEMERDILKKAVHIFSREMK